MIIAAITTKVNPKQFTSVVIADFYYPFFSPIHYVIVSLQAMFKSEISILYNLLTKLRKNSIIKGEFCFKSSNLRVKND